MAIAVRANAATAYGSRSNTSVTKPTGTASGDLIVLFLYVENSSFPSVTIPSGFTALLNPGGPYGSSPDRFEAVICYKVAGGSEPSSYAFTHTSVSASWARAISFTGVDNTTPIDATYYGGNGTGTTYTVPVNAVTTVTAAAVLLHAQYGWDSITPGLPSGYTSIASGTAQSFEYLTQTSAGGSAAIASTTSGSNSGSPWSTFLIPLRPASSGSAVHGDSASSVGVTGAATGHRGARTTAAGTTAVAGAAAGHAGYRTTTLGTVTITGVASGHVAKAGTAAQTVTVTGTATGKVGKHQTAAGTVVITGTASGTVHRAGTTAATITVTGTASGTVSTPGSASAQQTVTVTGHASGTVAHHTTTAGTVTITGHAAGTVSTGHTGSALGQILITGTASGHVGHTASAHGLVTITGTARAATDVDYQVTVGQLIAVAPALDLAAPMPTFAVAAITPTGGFD